ncbi:hypothetical protein YC2023_012794 [Brassica napus]
MEVSYTRRDMSNLSSHLVIVSLLLDYNKPGLSFPLSKKWLGSFLYPLKNITYNTVVVEPNRIRDAATKIVVFQFTVFDESIKERAKEIASEFPGVTKVVEVEGEDQLEVRGEFRTFELTKELMKIDESVETIKIVPDGVTEPEVKIQQQDEGKLPTNIQKTCKWPSDVASSSNGRGVQAYEFLGQAIDVAKMAKDMGVGAAKQAKDMGVGVGVADKAIGLGMNYYRNKKEKEVKAKLEPKLKAEQKNIWVQLPEAQKRGPFEAEKQKKIREEEETS